MAMPRLLKTIGLTVFIDEYEFFDSSPSRGEAIDYLVKKGISDGAGGAAWRVGRAIKLFNHQNLLGESLAYIVHESKKATKSQKGKAAGLLMGILG